jgi:hypothetical protein
MWQLLPRLRFHVELQVRLRFYGDPVLPTIDKNAIIPCQNWKSGYGSRWELQVRLRFHVGIASKATVLWRALSPNN